MAPDTTDSKQTSNCSLYMPNAVVQLHPELLKAAKRGDWSRLGDLTSEEIELLSPQFIVDIDIEDGDEPPAKWTHTYYGPDSILHVVASGGDGEKFLRSATLIYGKAKHLLGTCNAAGDTPLHCAARGGSVKMLTHLIGLASRDDDGGRSRLQVALRKPNHRGETALHEAVRWRNEEMVRVLMVADAELARFPSANGASPLYLAILLGHDGIAEQLYEMDNQLSYSGPDGQNALHVAALRSERMTEKILAWNNNLTKQGDRPSGRTPLHFAASWEFDPWVFDLWSARKYSEVSEARRRANLLLNADESSAYQSDNNGSFPIHVAALRKNFDFIHILLRKCPDCALLRDSQGKTFLHIAVENHSFPYCMGIRGLLLQGNQVRRFAAILNAQDDKGNTALHLAVMARRHRSVRQLIWNKEVQLNLQNKEGQTALDISWSSKPSGVFFGLDPDISVRDLLKSSGAIYGVHQGGDKAQRPTLNVTEEANKIKDSTTTIGVVAVLIITVSFAAAFQLPGGYSTGNKPQGTPELANKYSFQAFLVANNLALLCSALTTISLMYAGVTTVDIATRMKAFIISIFFLKSSARSLAAAFAFGTHAVLAPVARAASVLTWLSVSFVLVDIAWFTYMICLQHLVQINRLGIKACFRIACEIVFVPLGTLWPYVVIACFIAYLKTHGIH